MPEPDLNTITCPWWLLYTFDNPLRKLVHNPQNILSAWVKPGDRVLDIGCGMGYFTLTLAQLAGQSGKVIAADLQSKMLAGLRRRAASARLLDRIQLVHSSPQCIGIDQPLDFALAFWMVHEVRQPQAFLHEIFNVLKPGGKLLVVEPKIHVSQAAYERTLNLAQTVGFTAQEGPHVWGSRAVVFTK